MQNGHKKTQNLNLIPISCPNPMDFMTFITVWKSCWPLTFIGWTFLHFFKVFELDIEVCVLWYQYRIFAIEHFFLILALFTNLKAKGEQNGPKNENLRITFCIHFRFERLHFVKKGQNRCILLVHFCTLYTRTVLPSFETWFSRSWWYVA